MGCVSCKNTDDIIIESENKTSIFLRVFYFLIGVVVIILLLPIIGLVGIYMLFNTIILDKSTEIMPSLNFVKGLLERKKQYDNIVDEDEYVDIDEEGFDPNDYELIGVEEIQKK